MNTEALTETLQVGYRVLDFYRQSDGSYEYETRAASKLMLNMYHLGRAVSASPELLSMAEVRQFLDETSSVMRMKGVALSSYPMEIVYKFEAAWEDDEWVQLCIVRSGLQFFIDLFREGALAEDVACIDASDVDEFIRERGDEGYLSDNEIPPQIPLSHWWWWYPKPPHQRPD